jgi:adenylate kinase
MRKYVIMGIQGSGKGTHAKMLAEGFDLEHIAVGDIFRWNVQHHTKLGAGQAHDGGGIAGRR